MHQSLAQMPGAPLRDHHLIKAGRAKFRIKPHIRAAAFIVKLGIDDQLCLWPDLFQKQRLAPAGMADDHIGGVALVVAQLQCGACHRYAAVAHQGIVSPQTRGRRINFCRLVFIAKNRDRRRTVVAKIGQRQTVMPALGQFWRKMRKLARKVLMHEQNFHGAAPNAAAISALV